MVSFRAKLAVVSGFSIYLIVAVQAQDYIGVDIEHEVASRNGEKQSAERDTVVFRSQKQEVVAPITLSGSSSAISLPLIVGGGLATRYDLPNISSYSGKTALAASTYGQGFSRPSSDQTQLASANVGSLVVQLQQLQEEVRRINGLVEEQDAKIRLLKKQGFERYVDIDRRLLDLEVGVGGSSADTSSGDNVASGGARVTASSIADSKIQVQPGEKAAYQAAYDFVKSRNFFRAVESFKALLNNYPFGHYAPNAHYWLGELYLVIDPPDLELARQSFKLLLDQYPDHPKVPDALYKLGRIHFLKGNRGRAREYLDRVITQFKDYPAAKLAQDFIQERF